MKAKHRMTRIVATLGPASETPSAIRRLIRAGLDVARLNLSHGDHASHAALVQHVRREARKADRPVGILADLGGPKLRLGRFAGPIRLRRGQRLTLTTRISETDVEAARVPVDYRSLPLEAEPGHEILLADGAVRLRVERVRGHRVECKVLEGRELSARAGFSLPDATAVGSALTAKDKRDLGFAVDEGVDLIALSFVRRGSDLSDARRIIKRHGGEQLLVAKIETAPAVENLDEIITAADAVMVARGDLGIELPPERVPIEQKRIIRATTRAGKPVITATQMLESMRTASRPTRAETSDVANAVLDGSWAVMLSAETAVGSYPVESLRMMDRVVREAEDHARRAPRRRRPGVASSIAEGIAEVGTWLAFDVDAVAIVALTRTGVTARQAARFETHLPIYAYTPHRAAVNQMTLFRGVHPRYLRKHRSFSAMIDAACADLRRRREAQKGDRVIVLGGDPREPGGTNRLVVHELR